MFSYEDFAEIFLKMASKMVLAGEHDVLLVYW